MRGFSLVETLVAVVVIATLLTLLTILNFQTLIATKSSRVCRAAKDDLVLEFGLRRAQGFDGGLGAAKVLRQVPGPRPYVTAVVGPRAEGVDTTTRCDRAGSPVVGVHRGLQLADGSRITSKAVVNAAGPGSNKVRGSLVSNKVRPVYMQNKLLSL